LLLLSFTLTAFGVMTAARITQIQAFMALTQMLMMPLFFLSGALSPLSSLPAWLSVLTRLDPITYVVYPMRQAVFSHLSVSAAARAIVSPALTWGGVSGPRKRVRNATRIHRIKQVKKGRRRVATGANHPASRSSAFRRGPGRPVAVPRRGTRAPI
jgi:hypothetical protein